MKICSQNVSQPGILLIKLKILKLSRKSRTKTRKATLGQYQKSAARKETEEGRKQELENIKNKGNQQEETNGKNKRKNPLVFSKQKAKS